MANLRSYGMTDGTHVYGFSEARCWDDSRCQGDYPAPSEHSFVAWINDDRREYAVAFLRPKARHLQYGWTWWAEEEMKDTIKGFFHTLSSSHGYLATLHFQTDPSFDGYLATMRAAQTKDLQESMQRLEIRQAKRAEGEQQPNDQG